jgi:hypothetical protein
LGIGSGVGLATGDGPSDAIGAGLAVGWTIATLATGLGDGEGVGEPPLSAKTATPTRTRDQRGTAVDAGASIRATLGRRARKQDGRSMAGNVICSKCGHQNTAEQPFCGSCGAFLEWSDQKVEGDDTAATTTHPSSVSPAVPSAGSDAELAGLARSRSGAPLSPASADPTPVRPAPVEPPPTLGPAATQPPLVSPVRPGPSARSVPPTPADLSDLPGPADPAAVVAASALDPTIVCPACARPNPVDRTFCHSCGTLLRPKPSEPAPRGRRSGSALDGRAGLYRLVSILLLIAIIIVGSLLLTRLTTPSSGPTPLPSPTKASLVRLVAVGSPAPGLVGSYVAG